MGGHEAFCVMLLIAVPAALLLSAFYVFLRRRNVPGAMTAVLLMLAEAEWGLAYLAQHLSTTLPTKILWTKIEYIGIVIVPTAWLVFTLQRTGREKWLTRRTVALLLVVPLLILLLVFTNELHGLMWSRAVLQREGSFLNTRKTFNVGFWANIAYSYMVVLLTIAALVRMPVRLRHLHLRELGILLFGSLISLLGRFLDLSGLVYVSHVDLTLLSVSLVTLVAAWSLFGFRLGDVVPVAYETVIEEMSDGVILLDSRDRILDLNPAAQKMIGRTASEAIGRPVGELWSEWDRLREHRSPETGTGHEILVSTRDGQCTYDVRISPLTDWQGKVLSRVVDLRDITERKRSEQALRESEERYRSFVQNIHGIAFRARRTGFVPIFVHGAVEAITGYSPADLMAGKPRWDQVVHPDDVEKVRLLTERLKTIPGYTQEHEYRIIHKDGHVVWLHENIRSICDDSGQSVFLEGTKYDITARKQTEEALRYRTDFERLITTLSTNLINLGSDEVDRGIHEALRAIGEFSDVNRSYVFQFHDSIMSNTHEWCAEGIEPQSQRLQNLPLDAFPWFVERSKRPEIVHIPRVADLPAEADAEKKELQKQGIQSLIIIPMVYRGELVGFLGFDSVQTEKVWTEDTIALLRIVGEILVSVLERKKAEEALRESQRALLTLMSNLPGMAYRCRNDRDWTMEFVSDGCHDLTGYECADLLHNATISYAQLILPDDQEPVWNNVQVALREKGPYQLLYRIRTADGAMKWVWERGRGVFSARGELLALEGFIADITERLHAEEAERHSRLVSEAIATACLRYLETGDLKTTAQIIVDKMVGLTNAQLGIVISLDAQQRPRALGISSEAWALIKTHINEHVWWEFLETGGYVLPFAESLLFAPLHEGMSVLTNSPTQDPRWAKPGDESVLPIESFLGVPIKIANKVAGMIGLANRPGGFTERELRDAETFASTAALALRMVQSEEERARAEEQLRQAMKMEAVGRLAGGIAHDFNNLLTTVSCYADLGFNEPHLSERIHRYFAEIHQAGERAARLTHQLLAFSRRQPLNPRVINLNEILVEMDKILRRLIGEDIELAIELVKDLWSVRVDPVQLQQVIFNLAINARDAMPEGGRLTLETTNVHLDDQYAQSHTSVIPGDYVMLAISDTGIGMTEEVKAHLFEPFFTTKEVGKGTGLGLATCYGIVKQSGGYIWAYSESRRGTTFKIYLPRAEEEPSLPRLDEDATLYFPRGDETVLLVEDEESVRSLAIDILRDRGYQVLEASNGHEALLVAAEHKDEPLDLLLTDVVMPKMGGRALAEQLKKTHPDLKVLFMSGYTDDAISHQGVLDPGVALLQKPFTPALLARTVREALDS